MRWPMFHKGHVPANIFQCDLPLLRELPEDLIDASEPLGFPINRKNLEQKTMHYMVCNAYKLINDALVAWKKKYCNDGANLDKEITLQKRNQHCPGNMDGKVCWTFATWDRKLKEVGKENIVRYLDSP